LGCRNEIEGRLLLDFLGTWKLDQEFAEQMASPKFDLSKLLVLMRKLGWPVGERPHVHVITTGRDIRNWGCPPLHCIPQVTIAGASQLSVGKDDRMQAHKLPECIIGRDAYIIAPQGKGGEIGIHPELR